MGTLRVHRPLVPEQPDSLLRDLDTSDKDPTEHCLGIGSLKGS